MTTNRARLLALPAALAFALPSVCAATVPASAEDFQVFIGMGEDAYIGGVARRHGFAYDLAMKDHVYEKYIEMAPAVVRPFPGAVDLVRSLRARGIPVAVASSADRPKVEANLRALGLGTPRLASGRSQP